MNQLMYASLSHAHYWYEVGMLKVPAHIGARYPYHRKMRTGTLYVKSSCSTCTIILRIIAQFEIIAQGCDKKARTK